MPIDLDTTTIATGNTVRITGWTETMPAGTDPAVSTPVRNAMLNAAAATIDQGSGAGKVRIYTAAFGTLLVTITASDPAMAAASGGSNAANGLPLSGTAVAAGTAAVYEVVDSANVQLWTGSVS